MVVSAMRNVTNSDWLYVFQINECVYSKLNRHNWYFTHNKLNRLSWCDEIYKLLQYFSSLLIFVLIDIRMLNFARRFWYVDTYVHYMYHCSCARWSPYGCVLFTDSFNCSLYRILTIQKLNCTTYIYI